MWPVALAILALAQAPVEPPAPRAPPPAPASARVTHIRIEGDLDTRRLAADLEAELRRAKDDRAGVVILELDGQRDRPDVVWDMGRAVRESGLPVTVFIHNGPGGFVGLGALQLGVLSSACFAPPRTVVRRQPADDLRWMAPADTNWERALREMSGAMYLSLKDRAADPALAELLTSPSRSAWCLAPEAEAAGPWTIATSRPQHAAARARQIIFAGDDALERLEIDDAALAGLNLARTGPTNLAQVLLVMSRPAATRTTRTLASGLQPARRKVAAHIDAATAASASIKEVLNIRARARGRTLTTAAYHRAAREAIEQIAAADARLAAADTLIADYPELLRQPPPPPPPPGAKAPRLRAGADPISAAIADARKDLDKLRETAEEFASR